MIYVHLHYHCHIVLLQYLFQQIILSDTNGIRYVYENYLISNPYAELETSVKPNKFRAFRKHILLVEDSLIKPILNYERYESTYLGNILVLYCRDCRYFGNTIYGGIRHEYINTMNRS